MNPEKPRRLGRGLEALLTVSGGKPGSTPEAGDTLKRVPISQVRPNPYQPRKTFRPEELAELEASLKASGLLQPITVRPAANGRGYELIAGERRLRAATRLGWTDVPAVVKEIDDRTLLTLALVENLQRADLNPLEEADGYQRLMNEFGFTQQQVGDAVGKDRTTIANLLRVLTLPAGVRRMLQEGQITLGHARALLAVGDERTMVDLAREIVARGLNVRDVERRAREHSPKPRDAQRGASKSAGKGSQDPQVRRITDQLRRRLQTDVHLSLDGNAKGEIRIHFYSNDDLERLLELLMGSSHA